MPPSGQYTNVNAVPILGTGGSLAGGTGTYDDTTKTMSCGDWGHDLPIVNNYYNLNGTNAGNFYTFAKFKCLTAYNTSDFRDSDAAAREVKEPGKEKERKER
jgi:hypothetical protein